MITGQETADRGSFKVGETGQAWLVDQSRDTPGRRQDGLPGSLGRARRDRSRPPQDAEPGLLRLFNFAAPISREGRPAIGGERTECHIAKMLKQGANVLLLRRADNDLDVDTLRALETG